MDELRDLEASTDVDAQGSLEQINRVIQELTRSKLVLEGAIAPALGALEEARQTLEDVDAACLEECRTYDKPTMPMQITFGCVFALLGPTRNFGNWEDCQLMLSDADLIREATEYDIDDMTPNQLGVLRSALKSIPDLEAIETPGTISRASDAFVMWLFAVLRCAETPVEILSDAMSKQLEVSQLRARLLTLLPSSVPLEVHRASGYATTLNIDPSATVLDAKHLLETELDIPHFCLQLVGGNEILKDDEVLADHCIDAGITVTVIISHHIMLEVLAGPVNSTLRWRWRAAAAALEKLGLDSLERALGKLGGTIGVAIQHGNYYSPQTVRDGMKVVRVLGEAIQAQQGLHPCDAELLSRYLRLGAQHISDASWLSRSSILTASLLVELMQSGDGVAEKLMLDCVFASSLEMRKLAMAAFRLAGEWNLIAMHVDVLDNADACALQVLATQKLADVMCGDGKCALKSEDERQSDGV